MKIWCRCLTRSVGLTGARKASCAWLQAKKAGGEEEHWIPTQPIQPRCQNGAYLVIVVLLLPVDRDGVDRWLKRFKRKLIIAESLNMNTAAICHRPPPTTPESGLAQRQWLAGRILKCLTATSLHDHPSINCGGSVAETQDLSACRTPQMVQKSTKRERPARSVGMPKSVLGLSTTKSGRVPCSARYVHRMTYFPHYLVCPQALVLVDTLAILFLCHETGRVHTSIQSCMRPIRSKRTPMSSIRILQIATRESRGKVCAIQLQRVGVRMREPWASDRRIPAILQGLRALQRVKLHRRKGCWVSGSRWRSPRVEEERLTALLI
ncbi:hypothetical protein K402DRAFT_77124 [Aulographum hederae CBS 113979]|uniref:Uncharacterized protein n=1 Tax=Aulographum hederae CBS 113979 TaxID=1176131 RepID=A0A6G1HFR8_9PEZI|nr:hypothetical protein K402DRAFT_77124 [Aulographum hederae CBS 113979]